MYPCPDIFISSVAPGGEGIAEIVSSEWLGFAAASFECVRGVIRCIHPPTSLVFWLMVSANCSWTPRRTRKKRSLPFHANRNQKTTKKHVVYTEDSTQQSTYTQQQYTEYRSHVISKCVRGCVSSRRVPDVTCCRHSGSNMYSRYIHTYVGHGLFFYYFFFICWCC